MNRVAAKIKPKSGFSSFFHLFFTALIPSLVYILVSVDLEPLALLVILLSKWRIFAVQPRHWWPNIRANGVDILLGLSILGFMTQTTSPGLQAGYALLYAVWLLFIKPRSDTISVSLQALIAQTAALTALFLAWDDQPLGLLVVSAGIICYITARHFFTNFDEPHTPLYAHTWGYFGAALTWLLGHWLLYYVVVIAQPAVMLSVISFGLAALYYLEHDDRLSVLLQRQILFITLAIITVMIVFSDWGDKTV